MDAILHDHPTTSSPSSTPRSDVPFSCLSPRPPLPFLRTSLIRRALELLCLSVIPLEPGVGGLLQSNQMALWQEYIRFERSNPQVNEVL